MESEISATNLESVGKAPARRKGAAKQMAQTGREVANQMVGGISDALSFGKQRRAVSDAVSNWVSQKEDQVKSAYQRAKTALEGPTRYDYSKSKFKVSPKAQPKTVAQKRSPRRVSAKSGPARKGE
ncbi:MAG: hypothetical protein KGJ13_12860 [Patescibacteria group bacterium]|nr:hypothetical protein [Patescibacteria group bacterium]